MKILALTNLYPSPFQPHRAPYNRHQFRLLAEMHDVHVIAPVMWTDEWSARRRSLPRLPEGRRVVHDGLTVDHPRYWYTPKIMRGWYGQFFLGSVRATFRKVVDEFAPDIVFAPWAYPDGYAAVQLARQAKLPVVVQVHGSDIRQLEKFKARVAGTVAALRGADGVIAVSRELADRVIGMGAAPDNVRAIIDGVDRRSFSPGDKLEAQHKIGMRPGARHLLFVGNLVPVKGIDVLLAACWQLSRAIGEWELHLVGNGSSRESLRSQAQRLGLADRVHFHGAISHEQLPNWFRAADLFVLASRSEGVPNVLLEAAACGLPFVASRVGGIPEIAGLGASLLAPAEDPTALASAISQSLLTPPPAPAEGPRDRREAVADIATFLATFVRSPETRPRAPLATSITHEEAAP
jgi:glycosyltransferase involved in cell wall biosynthesis